MAHAPFCEVDNLIFSQLAYADFLGIIPEEGPGLTLSDTADKYFALHTDIAPARSLAGETAQLVKLAAQSKRFGSLTVSRHVNIVDPSEQKQFSATTFDLGNGTLYVAFRGTDNTLTGWKEDFNLGFKASVPAQREAVRYLENTAAGDGGCGLIVGGHSKGGNLAIYASVRCAPAVREQIVSVYNNDGPGFGKEFISSGDYKGMLGRIVTIVPQSSVVGMLLEHEEEYTVVESSQVGLMQHDAFSWEVLGARFIRLESTTKGSRILDGTLKAWLESMDDTRRERFVEGLFSIFGETGAETLGALSGDVLGNAGAVIKAVHKMDKETKALIAETVKSLLTEGRKAYFAELTRKKEGARTVP